MRTLDFISFGAPQWFWGLLLIPLLIALFIRAEHRGTRRLREFVSTRLLPQLAATVNRPRRVLRFALQLLGLALALASLAQPRWGYTFEDVKRKGLDLLIAVDVSRSMLSNDVQPNRLERVKLAAHDLINELQGDRVGLIAFAGRAFLQAPLTIDYEAAMESINDLDTKTIPEGGTNISEAITIAMRTFGKSAMGNRALVIFTDGEELSGDAVKAAKTAADAGVRIFAVGVGTPQGSLIPVAGDDGETAFVKDSAGQVVKSKLDEKRLREITQPGGGFYLRLENGPRTMQQIYTEGLAKMQAADIDARLSRRPIERYEWPLGAALVALAFSILIGERKRVRKRMFSTVQARIATAAAALLLFLSSLQNTSATPPGLDLYNDGKYEDAYRSFQEDLKTHPDSPATDKMQFDAGAAAFKLRDYSKAAEAFSQALLSQDKGLQRDSHYNLGRTLEDRADFAKTDDDALKDLTNAQTHYQDVLKLDPNNKAAKANRDAVKKKIERLKDRRKQKPTPTPTPPEPKKDEKNKQDQGGGQSSGQDKQQQGGKGQEKSQNKSASEKNEKGEQGKDQSQAKNEKNKDKAQPKPGESPSPSPGSGENQKDQPSPSPGEKKQDQKQAGQGEQSSPTPGPGSPTPGESENESPSPSPGAGEGSGENAAPSATPSQSPQKKMAGDLKEAGDQKSEKPHDKTAQMAEAEPEKEGQMSERQAEALLQSMKDEEARVQLDERKAARHVYNDW